jgi:hypothetical protein
MNIRNNDLVLEFMQEFPVIVSISTCYNQQLFLSVFVIANLDAASRVKPQWTLMILLSFNKDLKIRILC